MSITVVDRSRNRGRLGRERRLRGISVHHKALTAVAGSLALAAVGAIITTALLSNRTTGSHGARSAARIPYGERAAIVGALGYPYPVRCLAITISAATPDYALVDVDRTRGCATYRGYVNASLHRTDGEWRLVLDEGQLFVPNSLLGACRSSRNRPGWGVPHSGDRPCSAFGSPPAP